MIFSRKRRGLRRGPSTLIISRRLDKSTLLMVLVTIVAAMKITTKAIMPISSRIGLEKASWEIRAYVKIAVIIEENRILAEDAQSTDTPKCFFMKRKPMNKLGRLTVKVVAINPMTPK